MPHPSSSEVDEAKMAVVCALKEAINSLNAYPDALNAYFEAEKKALREYRDIPGMLNSLLITLKAQQTLVGSLKIDSGSYEALQEAENEAIEAAKTVIRIIKSNNIELERFLNAQSNFYNSYKEFLEKPLDNINALYDFLSAEIAVLENKDLKDKAVNSAHRAVLNAMKSSLSALESYPQALSAFLKAEKDSLESKTEVGMTKSLLDTHILLLKAQKAMLQTYHANTEAYHAFDAAEQLALNTRKGILERLKNPSLKGAFQQFLQKFEERYYKLLENPDCTVTDLQNFLDKEIIQLQTTSMMAVPCERERVELS